MVSENEEIKDEEEKLFIKRSSRYGRVPRPRSIIIGSQIISNPKLVKSLQNLDRPHQSFIRPSSSCINIKGEHYAVNFSHELQVEDDREHSSPCQKYLGILLAFFASAVLSLSSIIVKKISEEYHPYTLSFYTFQGIFLPSLVILLVQCGFTKKSVCQRIWPSETEFKANLWNMVLVLLRAIAGAGGTVLKVYSLRFMTAPDSTVISFSSPVFVVIAAWIFLDEKCGIIPIVCALAVLIGVGIITKPPWITGEKEFDTELLVGCGLAFGCMLLGVLAIVILRYIRAIHFALITFIYGLIGTISSVILCLLEGELKLPKNEEHWWYVVGVVVLTFLAQLALTLALQFEEAGTISLIRPSEIVFIFAWQFAFGQVPDSLSLIGATIVVAGVMIISTRSWILTLPETHSLKKHCGFLQL